MAYIDNEVSQKIKIGLRCISGKHVSCKECPYSNKDGVAHYDCIRDCAKDAIEYIDELNKAIWNRQVFPNIKDKRYF